VTPTRPTPFVVVVSKRKSTKAFPVAVGLPMGHAPTSAAQELKQTKDHANAHSRVFSATASASASTPRRSAGIFPARLPRLSAHFSHVARARLRPLAACLAECVLPAAPRARNPHIRRRSPGMPWRARGIFGWRPVLSDIPLPASGFSPRLHGKSSQRWQWQEPVASGGSRKKKFKRGRTEESWTNFTQFYPILINILLKICLIF
jgi:hypothetical protein